MRLMQQEERMIREIAVQVLRGSRNIVIVGKIEPIKTMPYTDEAGLQCRNIIHDIPLWSIEEIERHDIRVGDTVVIDTNGKLVDVRPRKRWLPRFHLPTACPVCKMPIAKFPSYTIGDHIVSNMRCSNHQCPTSFPFPIPSDAGGEI